MPQTESGRVSPTVQTPEAARVALHCELVDALQEAGLLPIVAMDVAETLMNSPAVTRRLRMLTGDVLLLQKFLR